MWDESGLYELLTSARLTKDDDGSSSPTLLGTPTSRDWKDGAAVSGVPENGLLGRQVINRLAQWHCYRLRQ
jgi:hypothetical protein